MENQGFHQPKMGSYCKQEHARAKAEVDSNQDQQWISHDIPNKSSGTKQLTLVGDCKKMVVHALYKL